MLQCRDILNVFSYDFPGTVPDAILKQRDFTALQGDMANAIRSLAERYAALSGGYTMGGLKGGWSTGPSCADVTTGSNRLARS